MNRSLITPTRIHQMRSKPRIVSITGDVGVSQARAKLEPIELSIRQRFRMCKSFLRYKCDLNVNRILLKSPRRLQGQGCEGAPRMPPIIAD